MTVGHALEYKVADKLRYENINVSEFFPSISFSIYIWIYLYACFRVMASVSNILCSANAIELGSFGRVILEFKDDFGSHTIRHIHQSATLNVFQ